MVCSWGCWATSGELEGELLPPAASCVAGCTVKGNGWEIVGLETARLLPEFLEVFLWNIFLKNAFTALSILLVHLVSRYRFFTEARAWAYAFSFSWHNCAHARNRPPNLAHAAALACFYLPAPRQVRDSRRARLLSVCETSAVNQGLAMATGNKKRKLSLTSPGLSEESAPKLTNNDFNW